MFDPNGVILATLVSRKNNDAILCCESVKPGVAVKAAAIVLLLVLSGWLFVRLMGANKDVRDLRAKVDSLKRQIVRLR